MRTEELIVYRDFEEGQLLQNMAWLMRNYEEKETRTQARDRFYVCIHQLIEMAGKYGFYGNLWHCYLAAGCTGVCTGALLSQSQPGEQGV